MGKASNSNQTNEQLQQAVLVAVSSLLKCAGEILGRTVSDYTGIVAAAEVVGVELPAGLRSVVAMRHSMVHDRLPFTPDEAAEAVSICARANEVFRTRRLPGDE